MQGTHYGYTDPAAAHDYYYNGGNMTAVAAVVNGDLSENTAQYSNWGGKSVMRTPS